MNASPGRDTGTKMGFFKGRALTIFGLLGLAGLLMGGLWMYWTSAPPPPPPEAKGEEKSQMESFSLTDIDKEGKRWKLSAAKAEYLKQRDEVSIRDISLEFYGPDQEIVYLQAEAGLVNTKRRELALKGEVRLERGDLTIRTQEVRYLPGERALVAPEEVILEGPRVQVSGKDLYIDLKNKRLILRQHRLTTLKLEKGLL
jgi:LPS export ABC transporter protein LptC